MLKKPGLWILLFLIVLQIQPSRAEIKWVDSLEAVYPEPNAVFDSLPIRFIWKKYPNISNYSLEISTDSLFRTGNPKQVSDTTYIVTNDEYSNIWKLRKGCNYYWRIRGSHDDSGYVRLYLTPWRSFTIAPDDSRKPVILLPGERVTTDSANVMFRWSSVEGTLGYRLHIADYTNPNVKFDFIVHDTTFFKNDLPRGMFLMSVASIDTVLAEYWSTQILFSIGSKAPGPPTLISPSDSSIDISTNVLFTWHPEMLSGKPQKYWLRVFQATGELHEHSQMLLDTFWVQDTSFYFTGLEPNTKYYWWAMTSSNFFLLTASPYYSFTTGAGASVSRQTVDLLKVTPNPISQKAIISLPSTVGSVRILVTDILGHRVKTIEDATGQNIALDLSDLNDGVYFLGVEGNGFVERKKIIKF